MAREEESSEVGELSGAEAGARPFAPGEMVACERCARANPPTRMGCLYCGAPLPVTERSARLRRPALRPPEEWETGFNVILLPRAAGAGAAGALGEAASLLRLETELLRECLTARRPLPLARAASREEAELVAERLAAFGLAVEVVTDEDLTLGTRPFRVRALELTPDVLVGLGPPGEEPRRWGWPEVGLLVTGRVIRKRVEVEERREKSRRDGEVVDARELSEDEAVLDIYPTGDDAAGWRVRGDNFDYSCLGAGKSLLARENFVSLVGLLRERAPRAVYDDEYASSRRLLAAAWPPAARDDTLGFRREGAGRYSTGAVTTVSNEAQFTRYSRLRYYFARRRGV
ncbi:MAG TPA: hypothetical protein VG148_14735 [Pyrinomonadaceae bacterium]|nr:hypothetical protein [Pyrinomonadaceae bacterium]